MQQRDPRPARDWQQPRVLPLAGLHLQLGCHPEPAYGWSMPLWYEGALEEQELTRAFACVFDRSHLGRFYVSGERADEVLGRVLATDPLRVPVDAVQRAVACREDGTILDIPTLCHLDAGRWLVVTGPRAADELQSLVRAAAGGSDVEVHDRRTATALVSLQGPQAGDMFARVFSSSLLDSLGREHCRELTEGLHRVAVARTSHVGEDGFWMLLNPDDGGEIWRALVNAGAVSAGLSAHDALRLEAGVLEAPAETPPPATPEAAGLGSLVHLTDVEGEDRDFPGAGALRTAAPPERRVAGLRLDGSRAAGAGSRVYAHGDEVGACVAAGFSSLLQTGIAIAYLAPGLERVEVETDGELTPAEVAPLPFVPPR